MGKGSEHKMVHKKFEDLSIFKGIFIILGCSMCLDYRSMLPTGSFYKNKAIFSDA